jgi:hypothetical protein
VEEGLVLNVAVLQNDIDENTRPRMYSRSKFENKSRSILVNIYYYQYFGSNRVRIFSNWNVMRNFSPKNYYLRSV